ncbi:MAG TPA: patatin-like phospholipase family protein, partial [Allosphingosinicella sp.]|nr:patatin-like phospholipase family protein [Allosphingosinicella sp.]
DASSEVKAVTLLAQPAAVIVLLLVVLLGRNLQGDREDVLKFEEGRKPSRRRDRKLVGANNVQYYLGCLWTILIHQTGFPDRSNPEAIRDFKRQTIGSPAFMLPLARAVTAEGAEERKAAWELFGRYCQRLLVQYFGPRFSLLFKALIRDGGLWHGDAMRDILAFVVFNKVEVAGPRGFGTRDELTFALREQPLTTILGEKHKEFATADLFELARRPSRREQKEERLKKGKGGLAALAAAKLHPARTRLDALAAQLAKLEPSPKLIEQLGGAPTYRLSAHQQFRAIRDWFDFALFRKTTKRDLVVTGTNITSSQPVFFRESLTPDFPVTEAVRISAGFPVVFKPTAVAYVPSGKDGRTGRRRGDANQVKRFYETHYCGYFIDGGFLNNHPMQAFSGVQAGADADNTPQEMLAAAFGDKVLGFHLTNNEPETCPFGGTFEETKGTRGFGAVLSGMMGTFYASGSTLRFIDPKIEEHTIAIRFGNLDLLDLKPDYFAVIDVQGANYETVLRRFGQTPGEGAGAKALDEMYKISALTGGDTGRDAQRKWRRAYKERAGLLKAPPAPW